MLMGVYEVLNALLTKTVNSIQANNYYSSADLYDVIARGEDLMVQVVADSQSGATASTVTVGLEGSNDGKVWFPITGSGVPPAFILSLMVSSTVAPLTVFPATVAGSTTASGIKLPAKVRVVASVDQGIVATRVIVAVRGEVAR